MTTDAETASGHDADVLSGRDPVLGPVEASVRDALAASSPAS